MATIVIHAGMPKAGSSSVQNWLRHNHGILERHGIRLVAAVPDADGQTIAVSPRRDRNIKSDELAQLFLGHRDRQESLARSFAEGLRREAAEHRTVVITGEALAHPFWRLEEVFLGCLEELAAEHRVRVAYYVRPQHETLESAWKQWGFRSDRSPATYLEHRARTLHYFETYTEVGARAPGISFEPRPFRADLLDGGSVAADFARHFLELDPDFVQDDSTWSNRALPLEIANVLRSAPPGLLWEGVHDNAGLNALKRLLGQVRFPPGEDTPASREILRAFAHETFEAGNRRLISALGWGTRDFVPPPDPHGTTAPSAGLEALDELWQPRASAPELKLLWTALESALAPKADAPLAKRRNGRRTYVARPRFRGRELYLGLELGLRQGQDDRGARAGTERR